MRTYHLSEVIDKDKLPYWRVFNDKGKLSGYIRAHHGNNEAPLLYKALKGNKIIDEESKEHPIGIYETMEQARDALFAALPKWLG